MATKAQKIAARERALARYRNEQKWMEEHGGNEGTYILRYGSKHDAEHYGDGGEAIYAADKAALDKAEAEALAAIAATRESAVKVHFYAPSDDTEYPERRDQRVRPIDHDEVTMTTKVEFPDGYRLVVPDGDLVSREA